MFLKKKITNLFFKKILEISDQRYIIPSQKNPSQLLFLFCLLISKKAEIFKKKTNMRKVAFKNIFEKKRKISVITLQMHHQGLNSYIHQIPK
jgi:hypothetical protein